MIQAIRRIIPTLHEDGKVILLDTKMNRSHNYDEDCLVMKEILHGH